MFLRSPALLGLALTALLTPSTIHAQQYGFPTTLTLEQVQQQIARSHTDHPRLLTSPKQLSQLAESLKDDPLRQAIADATVKQADALIDDAPIKRQLEGRRLLGESRRCVKRLVTLSMAFHLTGDQKYVDRAKREMLAVAAFSDWNPSHFLDVAEMTFAMALGYDWLFHELDEGSRRTIREAIVQKGVELPFTTRHKGWVKSHNNWGQVCHGGLTAGALAVMEDEPELAAKTVHNALHNVRFSMDAYAPNGSYPEGPGYWVYGTSYNVLLIAMLESVLGSDFGLTQAPGFAVTGQYPALASGPSGEYFNYADGGSGRGADPTLFWFAQRFRRPDWLLGERDRLQETVDFIVRRNDASYGNRFLPLALLWMSGKDHDAAIRMPLHWSSEGAVPITLHRSSWTDPNATFVGFKGGAPEANHGQMDIGSFVLDADGVRWALDLGAEGYNGIESRGMNLWDRNQDSDRWTIFRQSNAGHNTLVIDGQLQRAAGHGKFIQFSDDPSFPHSILDMSDVYAGQAQSVRRGIALLPSGEVLIQDELTGLKPGAAVRWGMITPATITGVGQHAAQLKQGQSQLQMQLLTPDAATWQEINTEKPRHEWDSPNRGTRMLAFEVHASAAGTLTFAVLATPGSCQESQRDSLTPKPLDTWSP